MVIDNYLLNEQQWIKVLSDELIQQSLGKTNISEGITTNVIYKVKEKIDSTLIERLIGIISEGSKIEKIKFEYAFKVDINEGDLVEVRVGKENVLYQITEGITSTEIIGTKE